MTRPTPHREESGRYVTFHGEPKSGQSYYVRRFRGQRHHRVWVDELSTFSRALLDLPAEPTEREKLEAYLHEARLKENL